MQILEMHPPMLHDLSNLQSIAPNYINAQILLQQAGDKPYLIMEGTIGN